MVILALGAHPDDVELNSGATLIRFGEKGHRIVYAVLSDCLDQPGNESIGQELQESISLLPISEADFLLEHFPALNFSHYAEEIRKKLEDLRDNYAPHVVLTASSDDVHQDHKVLYEESMRVFRSTTVLGSESLRSSLYFRPNFFVRLTKEHVQKKQDILRCYTSQLKRYYFSKDSITSLMIHRGKQIGAEFAEAYEVLRVVI